MSASNSEYYDANRNPSSYLSIFKLYLIIVCSNCCYRPVFGLTTSATATTIGFSYSVAGLLFPFQAGVTHKLIELNILLPSTPLNGASGGALAAACAASSPAVTTEDAMASSLRIATRCTIEGSFLNLERILRDELETMCTNEMVNAINSRSGSVEFLWTSILPKWKPTLSGQPFDSPEDLINVLSASCHIPLYSSISPITTAVQKEGEEKVWGMDGFLSAPSTLGCLPVRGADKTVFCTPFASLLDTVSSTATNTNSQGLVIAPLAEEIPFTPKEYVALALGRPGPNEDQHQILFELGMKCATRWVDTISNDII